jgi:hypothetical protein
MKKSIVLFAFSVLSLTSVAAIVPCKGVKKDGRKCQSTIVSAASGYCRSHNPSTPKCGAVKKDGKPCAMVVKVSGSKCRFHAK